VYHTFASFHIWSLGIQSSDYLRSLEYLEFIPGPSGPGTCTEWNGERQISLSAPILDTTLPELIDNETQVAEIREILKYWLDLDKTNLMRIRTGTLNFAMPQSYETNSVKWADRTAIRTFGKKHVDITDIEIRSSFSSLLRLSTSFGPL
jgi:hypothetical protein